MCLRNKLPLLYLLVLMVGCESSPPKTQKAIEAEESNKGTSKIEEGEELQVIDAQDLTKYDLSKIFARSASENEGALFYFGGTTMFIDTSGLMDSIPCIMLPTQQGFRYLAEAKTSFLEPDSFAKVCVPRTVASILIGSTFKELIQKVEEFKAIDYDCYFPTPPEESTSAYDGSTEQESISLVSSRFISIHTSSYYLNPGQAHENHSEQDITVEIMDFLKNPYIFKKTSPRTNVLFQSISDDDVVLINSEIFENWALGNLEDDYFDQFRSKYTGDTVLLDFPSGYLSKPLLIDTNQAHLDLYERETRYPLITRGKGRYELTVFSTRKAGYIDSRDYDWTVKADPIPLPGSIYPLNYSEKQGDALIELIDGVKDFYVSPKQNVLVLITKKGLEVVHIPTGKVLLSRSAHRLQMVEWCSDSYVGRWRDEIRNALTGGL